jgi:hypothetical protein
MSKLKDNVGWLTIIVVVIIFAIVSWFFSTTIFLSAISVLVGFLASYLLLLKEQERTWRREYSVKIAVEVYGALFKAIKQCILYLETFTRSYFVEWRDMKDDHRYFMVKEDFRERLDKFLSNTGGYSNSIDNLENKILPRIMKSCAIEVFKVEPKGEVYVSVIYKKGKGDNSTAVRTFELLMNQVSVADVIADALRFEDKLEISDAKVRVSYPAVGRPEPFFSYDKTETTSFWELCSKKLSMEQPFKYVTKEKVSLLEEAMSIKEELSKRIEEPWEI